MNMPKTCPDMRSGDLTQFELSKITLRSLNKFNLTPTEKLVLLSLVDHYPNIFPSQQTIADEIGIGLRTVNNAINNLRKQGIIIYETKKHNTYKLTRAFFGMVEPINKRQNDVSSKQNCAKQYAKSAYKEINEEKNKKDSFNHFGASTNVRPLIQRRTNYRSNCHIEGPKYQEYKQKHIEAQSPMDMTKEQAIRFIEYMPLEIRKKSIFAKQLREKWNL